MCIPSLPTKPARGYLFRTFPRERTPPRAFRWCPPPPVPRKLRYSFSFDSVFVSFLYIFTLFLFLFFFVSTGGRDAFKGRRGPGRDRRPRGRRRRVCPKARTNNGGLTHARAHSRFRPAYTRAHT
uniref:Uncharacterized protein n=1 Tax=Sipha flava TaxID=143950 RepID=A0A2S2QRE7_9HEMI